MRICHPLHEEDCGTPGKQLPFRVVFYPPLSFQKSPPWQGAVFCYVFFLALGFATAQEVPEPEHPHMDAWQKASRFSTQEAHEDFARALAEGIGDERRNQLGLALTRLGLQPRTQRNINQAMEELQKLIAENPRDETGLLAKFYLARVLEMHQNSPKPEKARELYLEVLRERTGNPLLELGAARVALFDLYEAADDPVSLREAAENLQELEPLILSTGGRREFHTMVGSVLAEIGGDKAIALRHMKEASNIPSPLPQVQSHNLLVTAALAEELGDLATAREFYTRFVEQFKRDNRNYSVRYILENLPKPENATDS
jgi:tetratricopeptide (TPR) repeat protein